MSSTELEQVEALLAQALPDPGGFADRVMEQLLARLAPDGPVSPAASLWPVSVSTSAATSDSTFWSDPQSELLDELAGGLGACLCWGEDPACPTCSGDGCPGWAVPDEELYREYVLPALRRHKAASRAAAATGPPLPVEREHEEGTRR